MADASTVSVLIKARDEASKAFKNVSDNAGQMAQGIAKHRRAIGMSMTAMGGAITGFALLSVKAASTLEESMNAVNVVFADGARTIHAFGEDSAKSVGMSTAAFNQMATVTGALLKDVGLPMSEVAGMTNDLAVRAADMASVFDTDVKDAMSAINQALRGETEAIRRYAGDVTDATLQTHLLSQGINTQVSEMTQQEKRLARVNLIMSQTNTMAGDFANTSDSLANRMRIAKSEFANTSAELGTVLLPIMTSLMEKIQAVIQRLAEWIKEHPTLTKWITILAAGLGAVMLVLGPLLLILPGLVTAVGLLSVAFGTLSVAMGPITLAIIGIAAVITAAIIVWKKWDDMSTKVKIAVVALGIALGPVTAAIVVGIAVWKNWDKIVDVVKKAIASFTKTVIGFIIKLGEGFLAITKWIPGMDDMRNAVENSMDSLRDAQFTMTNWADESDRSLVMTSDAWSGLEEQQYRSSDRIQAEINNMGNTTEGFAVTTDAALKQATSSYETETAKQTAIVKTFAETRAEIAQLNLEAERRIRDTNREEFLKGLEESAAAREQRAAHEERIAKQISDSWTNFKNDQDVTMKALKESNISFMDVVEQLAIKHDITVTQMADRLAEEGVGMGETWDLVQQQGAASMQGLISEIESASRTVEEKMADMGRVMQGASFTDAQGRSLGLGEGGMKGFQAMSAEEQIEGIKSGLTTMSTANLAALTTKGGAVAAAALDAIAQKYKDDPERIAAETALHEGGFGEHDTGVRLVARNSINDHLRLLAKRPQYAHLEQLSRDMTHTASWGQSMAIDIARQLAPQKGGKQGELLRLYASGGISAFAQGGIVTRPTLGLVGEAGPEAIVPLGRGGGMGTTNNFHFHGAVYGVEDLKEAVVEAVRDHAISGGFSGVFAEA